jgi:hypothetical protein
MVNVNQIKRIQALIKAHNNALKEVRNARVPNNVCSQYPHSSLCLNFRTLSKQKTQEHQRMYNRAAKAAKNYNKAYNALKKALGQTNEVNNNNLYGPLHGPNHGRPTANWNNLGNTRHVTRAATTIQRHVRGTQLRNRAGAHNPTKPVGYVLQMLRMKRQAKQNKN